MEEKPMSETERIVELKAEPTLPLPGTGGAAPKEFRILRAGWNKTEKGDFLFDEVAAASVMAAYVSKGLDRLLVDFEHQSQMPPPGGGPAHKPAAGWFTPQLRGGELWATDVSWTTQALSMLAPEGGAPEYRYFSPILFFDEETRRVTRLKSLALTNDPAWTSWGR
jgi:phage I-like protein